MTVEQVWEREEGEPGNWYARFEVYRLLGPGRTLEAAYREIGGLGRPGHAWRKAAVRWRWRERAEAWDASERERVRVIDAARRVYARERRLALIDRALRDVEVVLERARIAEVDTEVARSLLPVIRGLLRDLIAAQRVELSGDESEVDVGITAEQLTEATRRLRLSALARNRDVAAAEMGGFEQLRNVLAELYPDEASVRRVVQEAGLNVGRLRIEATAVDTWHGVLMEAIHSDRMQGLWEVAVREYGRFVPLLMAIDEYRARVGAEN